MKKKDCKKALKKQAKEFYDTLDSIASAEKMREEAINNALAEIGIKVKLADTGSALKVEIHLNHAKLLEAIS